MVIFKPFASQHVSYVHGGYRFHRSPYGHLPDDEFVAACVADLRDVAATSTSGDVACMIAGTHTRCSRLRHPSRWFLRGHEADPRRARDPVRLRRGPDRLGPYRRALLGLPGPRDHAGPPDLRQGRRQWSRYRWRRGPIRIDRLRQRQLHIDLRGQPLGLRRCPRQHRVPDVPRPAIQCLGARRAADGPAWLHWWTSSPSSARCEAVG